ncbi:PREDICTED: spermatogenesis-associated protein 31D1-like [Chrysochloris asiatica]|uniref:Spermatogenesis-associated protein 31D1-like n=1 Tax=Chrysochloris asiatica TaxID=185453 RepID=A0A9B0T0M6_CHRAS|nr:PREDICTED: spermatogenesis-associated protein 31D1-like [Chrysochloris asiatica]
MTYRYLCLLVSSSCRNYQGEVKEARKLLTCLKSPLGHHSDTSRFRQMLCPDPSCEVCNRATAEVSRLLFGEPMEDAAVPCASSMASTTSTSESSYMLASSEEPLENPIPVSLPESAVSLPSTTPLVDMKSSSPSCDSLPPEPIDSTFSREHFPSQPPISLPFQLHQTQKVDHVLQADSDLSLNTIFSLDDALPQGMNPSPDLSCDKFRYHCTPSTPTTSPPPECTLTVTQSTLTSNSQKHVPENLTATSTGGLAPCLPRVRGTNLSLVSSPEFWCPTDTKNLIPSTLTKQDSKPELSTLYTSAVSFGANIGTHSVEAGDFSFLSPEVLDLLERQVKKRSNFLSRAEKLQIHQELYPNHVHQKYIQLFWGLPSLHSESLVSSILVSSGCSSAFVYFNQNPVETEDTVFPLLSHPLPLSFPETQPHILPQTSPQSQHLPPTPVQIQAHFQPQHPPPPGLIRNSGVSLDRPQNEAQSCSEEQIHDLEWHVLKKQLEGLWGVPMVVKNAQEVFCPPAPNFHQHHRPYKAPPLISVLPGEFPLDSKVQTLLERHLRKRLIQQRWGLPRRILESLALMKAPEEYPEVSNTKNTYGLSWIHKFKTWDNREVNDGVRDFYGRSLENLHVRKDKKKSQSHNSEDGTHLRTTVSNKHGPELPTIQTMMESKHKDKRTSTDTRQIHHGNVISQKNLKHSPMPSRSWDIIKTKNSQPSHTIRTTEQGHSYTQIKNMSSGKPETNVTKTSRTPRTSVQHNVAPTGSLWNDTTSHSQNVPNRYMGSPQVLYAHMEGSGVSMVQQELWVPKVTLGMCHDKNLPKAAQTMNPQKQRGMIQEGSSILTAFKRIYFCGIYVVHSKIRNEDGGFPTLAAFRTFTEVVDWSSSQMSPVVVKDPSKSHSSWVKTTATSSMITVLIPALHLREV